VGPFQAASGTSSAAAATSTDGSADSTGDSAACVTAAPAETAGPYPGDGSNGPNVPIESGIVRDDIRSSFGSLSGWTEGVPMTIDLTLLDTTKNCAVGAGMAVYVWHCDRAGDYSLYSQAAVDKNYLRGVQVADQDDRVSFTSIFPACYSGRWPHIHFEVFDTLESAVAGENARLTSQIALPEDACKAVFAHDNGYAASVGNMSNVTLNSDNVFGFGEKSSAPAPGPGGPPPGGAPPNGGAPPGPPPPGPPS
jgi:protocatechuate 3,4-dioxygenase beta subunit